jgi:phenylpyruvate tautomerase PptA (4-oxalocrotonate tautomerase family)
MPKIDLTLPDDALTAEARAKLPGELAAALLRWEGAPDSSFFRSISWTHLHELPADAIHTADGPATDPQAIVEVTTPQGALSDRRRAGLAEEVTRLVLDATGWGDDAKLHVWVMCREIEEGSWAAAGEIVHFEQLREMAAAEREKQQRQRRQPVSGAHAPSPARQQRQRHQPVSGADAPSPTHLEQHA